MKTGAELIADERKRQIEKEKWTPEHDSDIYHSHGEINMAGICYAIDTYSNIDKYRAYYHNWAIEHWPWDMRWWKPTPNDKVRQLTKAGALIAAEIDRILNKESQLD